MNNDFVLNEIRKVSDPLYNPAFSVQEWTEIWGESCKKVAKSFEDEGLKTSAAQALKWMSQ